MHYFLFMFQQTANSSRLSLYNHLCVDVWAVLNETIRGASFFPTRTNIVIVHCRCVAYSALSIHTIVYFNNEMHKNKAYTYTQRNVLHCIVGELWVALEALRSIKLGCVVFVLFHLFSSLCVCVCVCMCK